MSPKPSTRPAAIAKRAALDVRNRDALALRLAGATLDEIAGKLGFNSPQAVHVTLSRMLVRGAQRDVSAARELHRARLERLLLSVWRQAIAPDEKVAVETAKGYEILTMAGKAKLDAVAQARGILDQLAKLDGLNAPTKAEVTGPDGGPIEANVRAQVMVIAPDADWMREYQRGLHEIKLVGTSDNGDPAAEPAPALLPAPAAPAAGDLPGAG